MNADCTVNLDILLITSGITFWITCRRASDRQVHPLVRHSSNRLLRESRPASIHTCSGGVLLHPCQPPFAGPAFPVTEN